MLLVEHGERWVLTRNAQVALLFSVFFNSGTAAITRRASNLKARTLTVGIRNQYQFRHHHNCFHVRMYYFCLTLARCESRLHSPFSRIDTCAARHGGDSMDGG